jgi:endonuclease/exonuclease/phosphatase family metal-dependent hydrolase
MGILAYETIRRKDCWMIRRYAHEVVIIALLMLAGCSAPQTQKVDTGADTVLKPELTLQVASLNLANHNKRIEKKDIERLSKILKKEQIEVLSVQGITRYPGVETRVDFVNELIAKSDMRHVFGEMMNSSGRQTGNGIFSSYPLRNNHNQPFDGVKSASFEAALQSSVDGGVRDIVLVSTLLPPKASETDQSACLRMISKNIGANEPLIVTGNLPLSERVRSIGRYEDVSDAAGASKTKNLATHIWYASDGVLKLIGARTLETDFGTMLIAQFGLFRQPQPLNN